MSEFVKPPIRLVGQDGNIFSMIGRVKKALREKGYTDKAIEFQARAFACGSYNEVLRLAWEYADFQ